MSFIRKIKRGNRVYLAEVENKRVDGKVRQKLIRYVGIDPDSDKSLFPECANDLAVEGSKVYGSVFVMDFIAKELGLHDLLGEHAKTILTLVYCHCHDFKSVTQVERWFERTDLNHILGIKKVSEKSLRNALDVLEKINHLDLQKSIFEMQKRICGIDSSSVVYDVTNTYFHGKHCSLGKKGKDKEGVRNRLLVQIGLAITKEHGLPIFHQTHKGNVHDSKVFSEGILLLKQFGFRSGTIVFDRGMSGKSNIFDLESSRWKVIAGVPMHRGIKSTISKMDFSNLENYRNRVVQGNTVFYAKSVEHTIGGVSGRLIILLNPLKKQSQKENRLQAISDASEGMSQQKELDSELEKFFSKTGRVNTHAIKREETYDGISILFTTRKYPLEKIVHLYFEKDIIEKSFQTLKGVLSLRPIRHWLEGKVKAHILICYLSYVLLTTFRFFIEKNRLKCDLKGLSALESLRELQDVYKVYFYNSKGSSDQKHLFSKLVTTTQLQKNILKAVSKKLAV